MPNLLWVRNSSIELHSLAALTRHTLTGRHKAKAKALEGLQDTDKARRLTGKQWFMQDKNQAYKEQQHE
eukprot:scaffold125432_cov15-Tisochrysis_lutea.AAC.1